MKPDLHAMHTNFLPGLSSRDSATGQSQTPAWELTPHAIDALHEYAAQRGRAVSDASAESRSQCWQGSAEDKVTRGRCAA